MFSYVRRPGSSQQPAPTAPEPRQHPRPTAPPPKAMPRFRRIVGGLAALGLAVAAGLVAAVPSTGAEQEQKYIVVLNDGLVDAGATAAAQQGSYGLTVSTVYRDAVSGYAATMTASVAARLAADPSVDFITLGRHFEEPEEPAKPNTEIAPLWWQRIGGDPEAAKDAVRAGAGNDDPGPGGRGGCRRSGGAGGG